MTTIAPPAPGPEDHDPQGPVGIEPVVHAIATAIDAGDMGAYEAMQRLISINGRLSDDIASLTKQRDYTRSVISHVLATNFDSQPTRAGGFLVSYVPSTDMQRVDGRAFRTLIGNIDGEYPQLAQAMRDCMSDYTRAGYVKIERDRSTKKG